MSKSTLSGISRRNFLIGASAGATALSLSHCRLKEDERVSFTPPAMDPASPRSYGDFSDVYRAKWTWDKIAKGTHTRANCISACAWDVYVKDGIVWREEQNAIYEAPPSTRRPGTTSPTRTPAAARREPATAISRYRAPGSCIP